MDKQYGETWAEIDKVRRRLEIKQRLKLEGIHRRYSPIMHLKGEVFSDPALDRYLDIRKRGRVPGAPYKPAQFFGMVALTLAPIFILNELVTWERHDYLIKTGRGEIPYEEHIAKILF